MGSILTYIKILGLKPKHMMKQASVRISNTTLGSSLMNFRYSFFISSSVPQIFALNVTSTLSSEHYPWPLLRRVPSLGLPELGHENALCEIAGLPLSHALRLIHGRA